MDKELSLRERKKYQTMSNILEEFLNSLENKNFNEILIDDICNKVNVSRVTFFRYFNSKEEVLDYFVMRWCYQRSVEIYNETYSGLEGIRQVFKSAAEIPRAEKIIVSLIHYYSKLKEKPNQKDLGEYARLVISQNSSDSQNIRILSLEEIFQSYLTQIKKVDESKRILLTQHLVALFYGIPFQVYMKMLGSQTLLKAYMDSLEIVFDEK
jgi:AcrR family transcriptional regulator